MNVAAGFGCARRAAAALCCALELLFLISLTLGCAVGPAVTGTFEKTLQVDGPVRLEISNGAGDIEVVAGPAGRVHIRGDFRVATFLTSRAESRAAELRAAPPISQSGNVINVGFDTHRFHNVTITYRITVPQDSRLIAHSGSGNLQVRAIRGPAKLGTGSGDISAENIADEVDASTGSGNLRLVDISGPVVANAGSGDMDLLNIQGAVRTRTGSGNLTLARPGGRVTVTTGSGDVRISHAAADLRISTGSGNVNIQGDPAPQSFWELHTSSGDITMDVPETAAFRLFARTSSGDMDAALPLTIEEKTRRSLRARAGSGGARIEAQTSSGGIRIR